MSGQAGFNSGGGSYGESMASGTGLLNLVGLIHSTYEGGDSLGESDVDGDGMPDWWERAEGLDDLTNDSSIDGDADGLTNVQEYALGTQPMNGDSDGDGLLDGSETSAHGSNPLLADSDGDGFSDGDEVQSGHLPTSASSYPGWRADLSPYTSLAHSINDASAWMNLADGSINFGLIGQPFRAGIVENGSFSNRSGFVALIEPAGSNPSGSDADGDGLPDVWESIHGFNPLVADASTDRDGDGMSELQEFTAGTNPSVVDSDGDGLSDFQESITLSTNPNLVDTDGDGFEDGEEIAAGLSALDASVYPGWDFVPENLETPLFTHLSAGGPISGGGLNSFSSVGLFVSPAIISDTGFSSLHGFLFWRIRQPGIREMRMPMGTA